MRKERLLKLADFLDTLPAKRFDISLYAEDGFSKDNCGTAACACGWATVVFPRSRLKLKKNKLYDYSFHTNIISYKDKHDKELEGTLAAAAFFDIPHKIANNLFLASGYHNLNVSPEEVAMKIRSTINQCELTKKTITFESVLTSKEINLICPKEYYQ